jgi:hypothetical protein
MRIAGVAGAPFRRHIISDGKQITVQEKVPWTFDRTGVSQFEFRKINPADAVTVETRYDESLVAHAITKNALGPGIIEVARQSAWSRLAHLDVQVISSAASRRGRAFTLLLWSAVRLLTVFILTPSSFVSD